MKAVINPIPHGVEPKQTTAHLTVPPIVQVVTTVPKPPAKTPTMSAHRQAVQHATRIFQTGNLPNSMPMWLLLVVAQTAITVWLPLAKMRVTLQRRRAARAVINRTQHGAVPKLITALSVVQPTAPVVMMVQKPPVKTLITSVRRLVVPLATRALPVGLQPSFTPTWQ